MRNFFFVIALLCWSTAGLAQTQQVELLEIDGVGAKFGRSVSLSGLECTPKMRPKVKLG